MLLTSLRSARSRQALFPSFSLPVGPFCRHRKSNKPCFTVWGCLIFSWEKKWKTGYTNLSNIKTIPTLYCSESCGGSAISHSWGQLLGPLFLLLTRSRFWEPFFCRQWAEWDHTPFTNYEGEKVLYCCKREPQKRLRKSAFHHSSAGSAIRLGVQTTDSATLTSPPSHTT